MIFFYVTADCFNMPFSSANVDRYQDFAAKEGCDVGSFITISKKKSTAPIIVANDMISTGN